MTNYRWKIVGDNLHIEAYAEMRGIKYGLLVKIPPKADPVKSINQLKKGMAASLRQNKEYVRWLNEGADC